MKNKFLAIFFTIVLLAGALRFNSLATIPPSLTWDEASWGYNAYSLGIDGRDEFGRFLPYDYLESFGDFKPPMYAYLDILPIKFFGLNEFAVRFPSAFFGTLTVILTCFLVLQIFHNAKSKFAYAMMSAFLLAISPWHINLSRAAFEANVSSFFLVAGVTCFLYAINKKPWFLTLSVFCFVSSMYTFNTARVVAPILVIVLLAIFFRKLWKTKKELIVAGILGILLIAPITGFLLSPQASLRFKEVNIFTNPDIVLRANQEIANDNNALWSKVLHNRRLKYGVLFLQHYFDNLNPRFLFISGDGNPKFSTQDVGQLYLWSFPFFVIGLIMLFRKKEGKWWFVPLWLFIGIIPAATARETPHALRIETTLPTFQIFIAYGVVCVSEWLRKNIKNTTYYNAVFLFIFLLLFFNVTYYLYGYYMHYSREYSGEWQYGYKESIEYVKDNQNKYEKIWVTNSLGRPYIYYLFYLKIKPDEFRKTATIFRDSFGFVTVSSIGKYQFLNDKTEKRLQNKNVLYIDRGIDVLPGAKELKLIKLLNDNPDLTIYTM